MSDRDWNSVETWIHLVITQFVVVPIYRRGLFSRSGRWLPGPWSSTVLHRASQRGKPLLLDICSIWMVVAWSVGIEKSPSSEKPNKKRMLVTSPGFANHAGVKIWLA
jgi:hypothetical protein